MAIRKMREDWEGKKVVVYADKTGVDLHVEKKEDYEALKDLYGGVKVVRGEERFEMLKIEKMEVRIVRPKD